MDAKELNIGLDKVKTTDLIGEKTENRTSTKTTTATIKNKIKDKPFFILLTYSKYRR